MPPAGQQTVLLFSHICWWRWDLTCPLTWPWFSVFKYNKRLWTLHKENTFRLSPLFWAREVGTQSLFILMMFLSPLESLVLCHTAGHSPPAGSGGGSLEAGIRSCVPQSSERLCRTRRTWAPHLCPHRSTPCRMKWKKKFTNLQFLPLQHSHSFYLPLQLLWSQQLTEIHHII